MGAGLAATLGYLWLDNATSPENLERIEKLRSGEWPQVANPGKLIRHFERVVQVARLALFLTPAISLVAGVLGLFGSRRLLSVGMGKIAGVLVLATVFGPALLLPFGWFSYMVFHSPLLIAGGMGLLMPAMPNRQVAGAKR